MRETLNQILADATGQTAERIGRDVDRDYIMERSRRWIMPDRSHHRQPRSAAGAEVA